MTETVLSVVARGHTCKEFTFVRRLLVSERDLVECVKRECRSVRLS